MTGTSERTPAEELRAAAFRLREVAENATPGPWTPRPVWSPRSHATSAVYSLAEDAGTATSEVVASGLADRAGGIDNPFNAVWIALAHPGLAEPLAVWLEDGAKHYEAYAESHGRDIAERVVYHGISVARVLNGGAA